MGLNIMGNGAHLGRKILVGRRSEEDQSGCKIGAIREWAGEFMLPPIFSNSGYYPGYFAEPEFKFDNFRREDEYIGYLYLDIF